MALVLGELAPPFNLLCVDGKYHSIDEFGDKKVLVVMFTCNHCPYVQAYEDRIVQLQRDYVGKGVEIVAINPNDEQAYPDDSYEKMVERSRRKGFNFHYLRDLDQSVATAYGPSRTPEAFVFDDQRRLRYHGRIDDNWQDPGKVTSRELRDAIDSLLRGELPKVSDTFPVGCTVKWFKKN